MALAFSGKGHYPDYEDGYALYLKRSRKKTPLDKKIYKRVVRAYCELMAKRLLEEGMIDLPGKMGSIEAAVFKRKPQYRGTQFIGYGAMDWKKGHRDGTIKAFGIVYRPRRDMNPNLRCFGFVANRRLFQMMKMKYEQGGCMWMPIPFNDDMI